jgi:hypothetical protein
MNAVEPQLFWLGSLLNSQQLTLELLVSLRLSLRAFPGVKPLSILLLLLLLPWQCALGAAPALC